MKLYKLKYLLFFNLSAFNNSLFGQSINLSHGTSIIAFITKDTVWVAADTKVHENSGNDNANAFKWNNYA